MKQVVQRLRDGHVEVLEVPTPAVTADGVLVDIRASLVSPGTERSKINAGRQSLIGKARSRPDQVRKVVEKAKQDGIGDTVRAVRSRLEQPSALGYSAAGMVLEAGGRVRGVSPGDRIACGGADYAVHAEIDHVPSNLTVPLPEEVSFEEGSFATLGSIALHGVRQADVRIGERVAVLGLGLVGQLVAQLLKASGCQVLGVDLSKDLVEVAKQIGATDQAIARDELTPDWVERDRGCDAVIITAATPSTDPVELAAMLCRDRGKVVIVGDVQMTLPRASYYGKELDLRLSRSYGPGRYDREYEERGLDYPIGYVRWTERRNMAAFLELVRAGAVRLAPLISERIEVDLAPLAYERLVKGATSPLGLVLTYVSSDTWVGELGSRNHKDLPPYDSKASDSVAMIGAGSFAQSTVIPGLRDAGFRLSSVASATGRSARAAEDRYGFQRAVTVDKAIESPDAGLVVIATRHSSHAELVVRALLARKAVFVEKPPALTAEQLQQVRLAAAEAGRPLAVGFNRRYAPLANRMRESLQAEECPFELMYRVNAGPLPNDHWLNDLEEGGGRLVGEGCHFIDFACWFAGRIPARVGCLMRGTSGAPLAAAQSFSVVLDFDDGSVATILYGVRGARGLSKEYVEVHARGRSAVLDDFRSLVVIEGGKRDQKHFRGRDKGHAAQFRALRRVVLGAAEPSTPDPLDTMAVTLAALRSAESGCAISLWSSVGD